MRRQAALSCPPPQRSLKQQNAPGTAAVGGPAPRVGPGTGSVGAVSSVSGDGTPRSGAIVVPVATGTTITSGMPGTASAAVPGEAAHTQSSPGNSASSRHRSARWMATCPGGVFPPAVLRGYTRNV